jgi:choline dehydrogenase
VDPGSTPDVVVVGAGSAGCVLAARLSEWPDRQVLLLEAGPDYPAVADLPADVADGFNVAESHDWGYASEPDVAGRSLGLLRGRLVGGCSALNATFAPRGFPADYDAWAALGNPGWSFDEVLPFFCLAETDLDFGDKPWHGEDGPLPIRRYSKEERSRFAQAALESMIAAGYPPVDDHNEPDALGAGPTPTNTRDRVRMSSALSHLAPARQRGNLTIRSDVPVDRVELRSGRAVGVRLAATDELVPAAMVVLAAGAYGSPAILLRSGIGPPDDLRALDIEPAAALTGVGQNLVDHPIASVDLPLAGPDADTSRYQILATWRSNQADARYPCDMHLFTSGPHDDGAGGTVGALVFSVVKPRARGALRLRSADPSAAPCIRLAHLEDPADFACMLEGLREARRVARTPPLADLVTGEEVGPAPGIPDDDTDALATALRAKVTTYHHPVGSCRMGPDPDSGAVVDSRGRVHGTDQLVIADASVIPEIPAANTNVPTIMVAERIAAWLGEPEDQGRAANSS